MRERAPMRDVRTLRVWQHGHRFVLDVYAVTRAVPADQRRFFRMAYRSACEALNHLILAHDFEYLPAHDFARLESALESIRKMLWRLIERSKE